MPAQCVSSRCAARQSSLGGPCTADNQCVGDPTLGVASYCSFSSESICGGEGSYCNPGQEGWCARDYSCQGGRCTKKTTNLCSSDSNCGPGRTCSYGICGGLAASCTPRPGSMTSPNCTSNCQFQDSSALSGCQADRLGSRRFQIFAFRDRVHLKPPHLLVDLVAQTTNVPEMSDAPRIFVAEQGPTALRTTNVPRVVSKLTR